MTDQTLGLRDRKREQTRGRLESAAVTLVLRDGLDQTTVDAISAEADVSARTFFNYFDSKEDAVLGIRDVAISRELVAEHIAAHDGVDPVTSTVDLLLGLIAPTFEGAALHAQRHEVLRLHPHLLGRHMAQMSRLTDPLLAAVSAILEHDRGDDSNLDSDSDSGSASIADPALTETFLSLCGGAVRATVKAWVADGIDSPVELLAPRATALVRSLIERIS